MSRLHVGEKYTETFNQTGIKVNRLANKMVEHIHKTYKWEERSRPEKGFHTVVNENNVRTETQICRSRCGFCILDEDN